MKSKQKRLCLFVLISVLVFNLNAQDSLLHKPVHKLDSIIGNKTNSIDSPDEKITKSKDSIGNPVEHVSQYGNKSLESLNKKFHQHTDSLKKVFGAPMTLLEQKIGKLTHTKDSLDKLNLPTASVSREINKLKQEQADKLDELNGLIDKAKKETLDRATSLHLSPQAESQVSAFTKSINGFEVPDNFVNPKDIGISKPIVADIQSMPSLGLPSTNTSLELPPLSQMQISLSKANAKALEKEAINLASQNSEMKSILKEEGQFKDMKKQMEGMKNQKRADSLAMQQLQPAVNHFAGKEKELTAAMDKISRLKQKFSGVKSLTDLPRRAPNPLKDKPWIERIVSGLNYFILSKNHSLIDFNPYLGWRFNPRITAAIGWNQRVGFSHSLRMHNYDRVCGVRATVSYLWTKGINLKIAPEVMDAYVPINGNPDTKREKLAFGFYAGVRKDFPLYKSLKGYSEVMYNFTPKTFQNVYGGDPVLFRFGMELKLKGKTKKK